MSGTRAAKSGINREVKAKLDAKYDEPLASECLEYIKYMLEKDGKMADFDTCGNMDNVHDVLRDGTVLARFANVFVPKPSTFIKEPEIKRARAPFQQMDLIGKFIEFCKKFGVADPEVFSTVDLYERENLVQVITCLQSLGRKLPNKFQAKNKGFEGFGPKESAINKRDFTEDQITAGKNIISLQYGSNKGASQAGQSFGKPRGIIDSKS